MPEFFKVVTPQQFFDSLSRFTRLGMEKIRLENALHRVLALDVISPEDLPPSARSTMDGYAVKASNTFGASDTIPALLNVVGSVTMGALPDFLIKQGQAAEIPTGGFLPEGTDAVVMIEYTNTLAESEIEVTKPVTRGENVLQRSDDVAMEELVLSVGKRMKPQDVGMLAGLGITEITVFKKPRVSVISTGDEIIPVTETPSPGQMRDMNTHSICALITAGEALPIPFGVVPDEPNLLESVITNALDTSDVIVLSGGSSVGERDHIVEVVRSFCGSIVHAHGVAIRPGKPTLLAEVDGKPVFGLPGHPVSAIIVAQVFLLPFLKYLEGEELIKEPTGRRKSAVLTTSVHSVHGREEYVRVKLEPDGHGLTASPVFGKSGMLSTLVKADGFFIVPIHSEGVARGEKVDVYIF
ncbi:MAG: molybdopterin molybdotransferase MoeA [Thermodesulfobacteriota bacterium]|nr:molybdopterin molybdotransferase MoeA [Thermodesulfobacteriota bacterium]